ncbi:hypothetical protein BBJ28_00023986 [Nothophytophthora sp. Chile5]|nr:hypothetical protein BBJ28_00023986 [Nothophytophthora sp. Chile5]
MDALKHAAVGAFVATGGLTAVQTLLARQLRRPSSLALSLGSFVGVFRLLEASGRTNQERDGAASPNASQAAAVAAAVALYLLDAERKTVVVSYAVVEAALSFAAEFTTLSDVKYLGTDAIATSQLKALDGLCQLPPGVLHRMRDEIPSGKLLSRCDVFHRGQSCSEFHTHLFTKSMKFAAKLYVPIYVVSVLVPKYKQWLWGPRPALTPLAVRYLRTCCCLTLLYQVPLAFSCVSPIRHDHATVMVAGALTTLALLAEHEHRRGSVMKAIGVYTTGAMAARMVATLGVPRKAVELGQFALFSAAAAVIFQRPGLESSRIMRMLYGYSDKQTAAPTDDRSAAQR